MLRSNSKHKGTFVARKLKRRCHNFVPQSWYLLWVKHLETVPPPAIRLWVFPLGGWRRNKHCQMYNRPIFGFKMVPSAAPSYIEEHIKSWAQSSWESKHTKSQYSALLGYFLVAHRMPYFSVLGILKYDSLVGWLTNWLVIGWYQGIFGSWSTGTDNGANYSTTDSIFAWQANISTALGTG